LVGWLEQAWKIGCCQFEFHHSCQFCCHQVVSKYKKSEEHIVFFFSFVILPAFCFDLTSISLMVVDLMLGDLVGLFRDVVSSGSR